VCAVAYFGVRAGKLINATKQIISIHLRFFYYRVYPHLVRNTLVYSNYSDPSLPVRYCAQDHNSHLLFHRDRTSLRTESVRPAVRGHRVRSADMKTLFSRTLLRDKSIQQRSRISIEAKNLSLHYLFQF